MAYNMNGKTYTDHALMDEIMYNTQLILAGIVLKNSNTAAENETEQSIVQADYYVAIKAGTMRLNFFPLTVEMLTAYGYSKLQATSYVNDYTKIPDDDKDKVLAFCNQYFLDNYVEYNNYYRMLYGLPEYGTTAYDIYVDPSNQKLLKDNARTDFNFSLPLHQYTYEQLNTLESIGIMDDIRTQYSGNHYKYLKYLGAKRIDYYTARVAYDWDILYMPSVELLVSNRFKELYKINKEIYYNKTYQEAYMYESEYYAEMVMLMAVCQTCTDMIVDTPEWYIRRDVFDLRSCQYFLESQGVTFFKQIPLKYQIRIVKNLNKLISYKSTNQNIDDILEIFSVEGTEIYKYYLFKKFKRTIYDPEDGTGTFIPDPDDAEMDDEYDFGDEELTEGIMDMTGATLFDFGDEAIQTILPTDKILAYDFGSEDADQLGTIIDTDKNEEALESTKTIVDEYGNIYDLEFIKVPLGENYDEYIKDQLYREDYDTVTYQDPYWDGEDVHSYVKNKILQQDFTIESTKYLSLDYTISMEEYNYQMAYMLGMIFHTDVHIDDIELPMPTINADSFYSLRNLFIFLVCLNALYNDINLQVRLPQNYNGEKPYEEPVEPDPIVPEEPEEPWELTDIDFGDEDTEIIVIDQYTEYYDFGYHYDINPREELRLYDYGDEDPRNETIPDQPVEPKPEEPDEEPEEPYIPTSQEKELALYDWLRALHPEFWVDLSGRILGFNLAANLEEIALNIGDRHSAFGFERGYTLEELGCSTFNTTATISSIEQLLRIYQNNTKCYHNLKALLETPSTRDELRVYQYVFDSLFTTTFPFELYRLNSGEYAVDYIDILAQRDYSLYEFYLGLASERDPDTRKDNIRGVLNDIADVLEYYLSVDHTNYALAFINTHSFTAVTEYISLMINFFKSWKVYFLDPVVNYTLDDRTENSFTAIGHLQEMKYDYGYEDNHSTAEYIDIKPSYSFGERELIDSETLEFYSHYIPEKLEMDYDGLGVEDQSNPDINSDYVFIAEDLPVVNGSYVVDGGPAYLSYDKRIRTDITRTDISGTAPFFQVNGGNVAARLDVYDLDGGGPLEMEEYMYIDGGHCNEVEENAIVLKNLSKVINEVEGGPVTAFHLTTKSVDTTAYNYTIEANLRISSYKNNAIQLLDNGIFVEDTYASTYDFEGMRDDMTETKADYIDTVENYIDTLKIHSDPVLMNEIIDSYFRDKFTKSIDALHLVDSKETEKEILTHVDTNTNDLRQWFIDLDLFGWGHF